MRISFNQDSIDVLDRVVKELQERVKAYEQEALCQASMAKGIHHVAFLAGKVSEANEVLSSIKEILDLLNRKEDNDINTIHFS